jgi:two-component system sensor histidine kinase/response regulator
VHGAHPEWEGSQYGRTPIGSALIEAAKNGGDFTSYDFSRPTSTQPVGKLAYSALFTPWQWVITTGTYVDDIAASFRRYCLIFLIFLIPLTIALTLQVMLLSRQILKPLTRLSGAMRQSLDLPDGEPRPLVEWRSADEIGDLVASYNQLLSRHNETERQLTEHRLHLETKVKRRTEELEMARQYAERSDRAKTDFLTNVGHEIRTPMNGIIGLTHLLARTRLNSNQRDYLAKIDGAVRSMIGVISDIADFSQIETQHLTLDVISFTLDGLLRSLSDIVSLPAGSKGLDVVFDIDAKTPQHLRGDPLRLNQILSNIIENAVKYTENGVVTLSCKPMGDSDLGVILRFAITDTGVGLSEVDQKSLFEPPSHIEADRPAGLGLATCKQLVALMGGEIGVESAIGRGSTFWFTVRLGKDPRLDASSATPLELFDNLRVLIADDNLLVQHTVASMLSSLGFRCETVANGPAVLETLSGNDHPQYDLVIVDWMMPDMDGVETVRRIRALDLAKPPHIMMISGYGQEELLPQILSLGLDGVLTKPVNRGQLIEMLERCFNLSAQTRPTGGVHFQPGTRVLVVEDNEINRMVAEDILTGAGISVTVATDGRLGIDAVMNHPFDAVLMDLQMPVIDGYEATREIRSKPRFAVLPIIALTANAKETDHFLAMSAGMNDYIVKPFEPDKLLQVLCRWINRGTSSPRP